MPILILDKSAFEMLSQREHMILSVHFHQVLTPILAVEVLGDLAKQQSKNRLAQTAEEAVQLLARKFGGSGPAVNEDFRTLCVQALLGADVPNTGQYVPSGARRVPTQDGGFGIFIDAGPFNKAIMRWADQVFCPAEREVATAWRFATKSFSQAAFGDQLNAHRVIIPRASSPADVRDIADELLREPHLQDVWLEWLLRQLRVPADVKVAIETRWNGRRTHLLRDFAWYAHYCVRAHLSLVIATRSRVVKWNPTNLVDLQYLYYLPFCMVFASHDRLHAVLAPLLMRPDQSFVLGEVLKKDLRRIADEREALTPEERRRRGFAMGSYPVPTPGSVVAELWQKHCRPWHPGSGNAAIRLSDDEAAQAIREAKQLFAALQGHRGVA